MKKVIIAFIFYLNFFQLIYASEKSIIIKFKVNDELITNYDIIKETKYLRALNKQLDSVDKKQLNEFAKNSLLKEKIKKNEIEKYYTIDYESNSVDVYLENFMKQLEIENLFNFEIYLKNYETSINDIKKKLMIEQTWNKMIFDIYKDRIVVDQKKITESLEELIKEKKEQKSFELYEIFFSEKNKNDFKEKYEKIILSIENIGFEKTALIYSLSDTAKVGGKIGWINQNQLSKKILSQIEDLNLGSYSKPINTAGGSIILKINNIKRVSGENIDKELELSKIISAEKNRQLNEFSIIHYKKTETKSYVKKF